ncbi:hypothetical protein HMPREF9318_00834 [Streptococcus urinalis FB127-CNA-2]|uniref:ABC transporter, solute-binding domain protein n=1 Tax=Streptococcus urinalis 2285-97 TaxID=764291 RepID=G5KHW8_9STRE|nr:substrate-binding domain-containing protein [Streptococcus urinalis]EHJ57111.1 ABC transporter, solute-binding domain protein [Streptococcus urinalis 2285-97]EKS22636.1 hypothetical protein HMPREF9318_00834 [Streptococcus urinalis FB127-CNA-2]VEF32405.1 lipoprotein [Streptococcus urinalis]
MKMKKFLNFAVLGLAGITLAACGNNDGSNSSSSSNSKIVVVSREDGSGTRGAFTEITGILKKDGDKEVDNTSKSAVIQNSTEGVISAVSGDKSAIGYISLGSLNNHVKALKVDGVKASEETVLDGDYPLQRPFNLVYKDGSLSGVAKDFVSYIHSTEGQKVVTDNKYIQSKTKATDYTSQKLSGKISLVGSTSVSPLMEKLAEAYKKLNPDVTIDITSNGSSAGITAAKEKSADIGMVSRELTPEESKELKDDAIANDGIAVVVNTDNKLSEIKMKQITNVFTGKVTTWDKVK